MADLIAEASCFWDPYFDFIPQSRLCAKPFEQISEMFEFCPSTPMEGTMMSRVQYSVSLSNDGSFVPVTVILTQALDLLLSLDRARSTTSARVYEPIADLISH